MVHSKWSKLFGTLNTFLLSLSWLRGRDQPIFKLVKMVAEEAVVMIAKVVLSIIKFN